MNWISNYVRPKINSLFSRREVPENLWTKCPECGTKFDPKLLRTRAAESLKSQLPWSLEQADLAFCHAGGLDWNAADTLLPRVVEAAAGVEPTTPRALLGLGAEEASVLVLDEVVPGPVLLHLGRRAPRP